MELLGEKSSSRVHTSRLKDQIVPQIPALGAYNDGRDVYLVFKQDVRDVLQAHDASDGEAMYPAKEASVVRNVTDCSSFMENYQNDFVPKSLYK